MVAQEEIDQHLDLYRRGYLALDHILGQPPVALDWWAGVFVTATDPRLSSAWRAGRVLTGVPSVDMVVRDAYIDEVTYRFSSANGDVFELHSSRVMAPQNIALALEAIDGLSMDATPASHMEQFSEVVVERHDELSGKHLVYRIGWGDCLVACDGKFYWRVLVTDDTARLVEAWGDPIPPDVMARWRMSNPDR